MFFLRDRRVWGRSLGELTLEFPDPVASGFMRVPANASPEVVSARPRCVVLRPILGRDHWKIQDVRFADHDWLSPWEASQPPEAEQSLPSMSSFIRLSDRQHRQMQALHMMVEVDGEIAGQFSLQNVHWGAARTGMLGYWLTSRWAGCGLGVASAATVLDVVIGELGLHRVEVCVRPENTASMALCRRLGLIEEGLRRRYLYIAGQWADHIAFVADAESYPSGGYLERLLRLRAEDRDSVPHDGENA